MIPVVQTLFDARALGRFVADEYAIGTVEECRLWRSFVNDVYRVDAGGRHWWLRIHPFRWRMRHETEAEVQALLTVAAAGGSIARPLARRNGLYLVGIEAPEGMRTGVLFEDAPGTDLSYAGPQAEDNARRYGAVVARLHAACDAVRGFPAREAMALGFCVTEPSAVLSRHVDAAAQADLRRITHRLTDQLQANGDLTTGFCHGDLNCSNIHFSGEAAVALDFDCCGWGWRAFERAAFARGVTWHSKPGAAADALVRAYFDGYGAHRAIPAADRQAQPAMLLAQRLWVTALHLAGTDRWGAAHFGPAYAARAMDWLRAWEPTLDPVSP